MPINCGEVTDLLSRSEDESFDGCFCDPPYGIKFMGRAWDHGVPSKEVWREVLRVIKPGAPLLAFGGTRTYHRLACAVEDAGFEIRDSLMWLYGQGFPKSLDISKAIDKMRGDERKVTGVSTNDRPKSQVRGGKAFDRGLDVGQKHATIYTTIPGSNTSARWSGYGTALKPAFEPIILAMKPLSGTFAENALAHGVAGLNVDGCRIGTGDRLGGGVIGSRADGWDRPWKADEAAVVARLDRGSQAIAKAEALGRWPANVILAHHPSCQETGTMRGREIIPVFECHPLCAIKALNDQSGTQGVSRFFYCPKVSPRERSSGLDSSSTHPTMKPISLCTYFSRLILPPAHRDSHPRRLLVPFAGVGSECIGALLAGWEYVYGIEREAEYVRVARQRRDWYLSHSTNQ